MSLIIIIVLEFDGSRGDTMTLKQTIYSFDNDGAHLKITYLFVVSTRFYP